MANAVLTPMSLPVRGLVLEGLAAGPLDGPLVVLLHGFPQSARAFSEVLPHLGSAGLRAVAVTQRGYSPGGRTAPGGRSVRIADCTPQNLAHDVLAVAGHLGAETFSVVGHDLGGLVAWQLAATAAPRLRSAIVLSTPHPAAYASSLARSSQALRSAYIPFFSLPVAPEVVLGLGGGRVLRWLLRRSDLGAARAESYVVDITRDGRLHFALHWYRALLLGAAHRPGPAVVPTTFLWGDRDLSLGRTAAEATAGHVDAEYRFLPLAGASHWLPEQAPDLVAAAVVAQVRAVDDDGAQRP